MEKKSHNPFFWGKITTGEYFADRKDILKEIILDISGGKNLILHGPRRIGKTSLISETFDQLKTDEDYHTILIDLFESNTIEAIAGKIFRELLGNITKASEFAKKVIKGISVKTTGENLELSLSTPREILIQTLNVLKNESDRGKKIVVAFDEFQEIEDIDESLLKVLRAHVQTHKNITYIFTGSHHRLLELFSDQSQPFYKFGKLIQLYKPEITDIHSFINHRFSQSEISIEHENIDLIISATKNFPYYTFLLASELWNECQIKNVSTITNSIIERVLSKLMVRYSKIYEDYWSNFSKNQRKVLKILSETNSPFKKEIVTKYSIPSSSIQRSIKSLINNQIIWNEGQNYEILDPIFELWMKKAI